MTPQLRTALIRAAISCVLAFFAPAGVVEAVTQGKWQLAASAGGAAVLVYLFQRGGAEGIYDAWRASNGNVLPGDIQAAAVAMATPATSNISTEMSSPKTGADVATQPAPAEKLPPPAPPPAP